MDKSLYGHGIFALLATILAYLAWSHPTLLTQDQRILIFAGDKDHLQRLVFQDHQSTVELEQRNERWLVKSTIKAHTTEHQGKWFPVSSQGKTLIEQSAPLYGLRTLGPLTAEQQQSFGLEQATTRLTLHHGQEQRVFAIGSQLYGSSDYYMMTEKQLGFLLAGSYITPWLQGAPSLADKQLIVIDRNELKQVTFQTPQGQRTFLPATVRPGEIPYLVAQENPTQKMDNASTWLEKILRVKIQDYGQQQSTESPMVRLHLQLNTPGNMETLAFWQQQDGSMQVAYPRFPDGVVVISKAIAEPLAQMLTDVMRDGQISPTAPTNPQQAVP